MSAIITEKFRQHNADQFVESFTETSNSTYYLFVGKATAYTSATTGGSDSTPLTPVDSVADEFYFFDDIIAAKRITTSDVSRAVPRRNWTTGTTYDMYRHDYGQYVKGSTSSIISANSGATNLNDSSFYVLSSSNHVYKVLSNDGNTASTVEPTGTSTSILTTGDNYKWKYMYSLSASEQTNFLSTDFMHVSTDSTVAAAAVDGAIDTVLIKTAGSGGTNGSHTSVAIRGDGSSGACTVVVSGGAVTSVTVTTAGTGYTFGYIRNADIDCWCNTFSDAALTSASAMGGSGGEVTVQISPKNGHGYDAVSELAGHYVMLRSLLTGAEGDDFLTGNDFRNVALVTDPTTYGTSTVGSAATYRQVYAAKLTSVTGTFTPDERITQATTGAVGKVVEWDSTLSILYYQQERYGNYGTNNTTGSYVAFSGANVITGSSSSAVGTPDASADSAVTLANSGTITFTDGYANPELESYSGNMIYLENRKPISRATDQTEDIKIIVEF